MKNFGCISLFSGAGGLDIGLEKAGINVQLSVDFEEHCVETLTRNGKNAIKADVSAIASHRDGIDHLLRLSKLKQKELFLIAGGPPCQSFSTAGKRGGGDDPRGSLLFDFQRIIDQLKPRFFVLENVKGIVSATATISNGRRVSVLELLTDAFRKSGYSICCDVLDAVDFGVPQHRERFVMLGSRDNESLCMPFATNFQTHQNQNCRWKTLRSAIEDLEKSKLEFVNFSDERRRIMEMVPEGGNWRDLTTSWQRRAMGGAFDAQGGRSAFYRRLSYDRPSATLTTHPAQRATTLCHPVLNRPLAVEEYQRIQSFPETWLIGGRTADKYRQLGNAVPVGLGEALGQLLVGVSSGTLSTNSKKKDISSKFRDRIADYSGELLWPEAVDGRSGTNPRGNHKAIA